MSTPEPASPRGVPETAAAIPQRPPVSRRHKLLVILLVALLCIAFAGMIWALIF
ncbi:MAG TPA: hypothetical protein VEY12_09250 [Thermoplasmata archaeon]|nr:hypothetical protein [Thermoplasmata archaeon]